MDTPAEFTRILASKKTLEDLKVPVTMVHDLVFKILFNEGNASITHIADVLHISQQLIDDILVWMQSERLVDVTKAGTLGRMTYSYRLTDEGMSRARASLERNHYVGPVPVDITDYQVLTAIQADIYPREKIEPDEVVAALSSLILPDNFHRQIGPAINTGRSLFLYGPPGNGKTTIAQLIGVMIAGTHPIYIPYAIAIGGQIIQVHDPLVHINVEVEAKDTGSLPSIDRRWGIFRPPVVMTGGELDMASLDLRMDPVAKFYEAPLQLKANGGMLLIDDFGRQRMRPQELLNRWIVPLEEQVDFFRLQTGQSFEIPFRQLVIFSTNLNPFELVDEAFLRRIQMKVHVKSPDEQLYYRIFNQVCRQLSVDFNRETFIHLIEKWYRRDNRILQAVHPRDILKISVAISEYEGRDPKLNPELIDAAALSYFVDSENNR